MRTLVVLLIIVILVILTGGIIIKYCREIGERVFQNLYQLCEEIGKRRDENYDFLDLYKSLEKLKEVSRNIFFLLGVGVFVALLIYGVGILRSVLRG